jgi:hypothetical protein
MHRGARIAGDRALDADTHLRVAAEVGLRLDFGRFCLDFEEPRVCLQTAIGRRAVCGIAVLYGDRIVLRYAGLRRRCRQECSRKCGTGGEYAGTPHDNLPFSASDPFPRALAVCRGRP